MIENNEMNSNMKINEEKYRKKQENKDLECRFIK